MASGGQVEFPVWGGQAVVCVTDGAALETARVAVEETLAEFDAACSSWREDSELAGVNAGAGGPVRVGRVLLETVQGALRGAELTAGDFDPTVGQALINHGFTPAPVGAPGGLIQLEAQPGWRAVRVDAEHATIQVPRGVRLDLGAIAKARAADIAASAAVEAIGSGGVLVGLSGDISTAGAPPAGGWRVRVTDDHRADPSAPGQWIEIRSGGLATSSTTVRVHAGSTAAAEGAIEPTAGAGVPATVHHVIDPATGASAAVHYRTVSVAAASCEDANIASTAAIVRGAGAAAWLAQLSLPSRLVRVDGIVHHVAGWPSGAEDLPVAPPPATQEAA